MKDKQILLLGIGNILLADEGFGVHAVNWLARHYAWPSNISLVDGGTRGLMLLDELMQCDLAVILDIALADNPPGTFYFMTEKDLDRRLSFGQSMHQTSINDILTSCELADHRPQTMIFCMEPFECQKIQVGLSPQAANLLPAFCEKVIEELAKTGIMPEKIKGALETLASAPSRDAENETQLPQDKKETTLVNRYWKGSRILVDIEPTGERLSMPRAKTARQLLEALRLEEETALVIKNGALLTPDRRIWPGDRIVVRLVGSRG